MTNLPPMKGYQAPPLLVEESLKTFQEIADQKGQKKRIGPKLESLEPLKEEKDNSSS